MVRSSAARMDIEAAASPLLAVAEGWCCSAGIRCAAEAVNDMDRRLRSLSIAAILSALVPLPIAEECGGGGGAVEVAATANSVSNVLPPLTPRAVEDDEAPAEELDDCLRC